MGYADYTFYSNLFLGSSIPKEDFPRLALRASQFLDYYTMGKAKTNPDMEALKMACCAIAEKYFLLEQSQRIEAEFVSESGAIKSESVGSYSVSYQTAADKISSASSVAENARTGMAQIAQQYLVGTNLLYRGRCCMCTIPIL